MNNIRFDFNVLVSSSFVVRECKLILQIINILISFGELINFYYNIYIGRSKGVQETSVRSPLGPIFFIFMGKIMGWRPLFIQVFTNSPQHKTAIIANFVLAVPLQMNKTDEIFNIEMQCSCFH